MTPTLAIPQNVLIKDGEPIVVIRPKDPARAKLLAQDIMDRQRLGKITPWRAQKEFNQILESQLYTYIGFLRNDSQGIVKGGPFPDQPLQEGDSFIGLSQLAKLPNLAGGNN